MKMFHVSDNDVGGSVYLFICCILQSVAILVSTMTWVADKFFSQTWCVESFVFVFQCGRTLSDFISGAQGWGVKKKEKNPDWLSLKDSASVEGEIAGKAPDKAVDGLKEKQRAVFCRTLFQNPD